VSGDGTDDADQGRLFHRTRVYPGRTYDISPDGQRFLLLKADGGADHAATRPSLIVVQHFDEELKRLVPAN